MTNATNTNDPHLYPADIQEILEEFEHLLQVYDNFRDRESIYSNFIIDVKRLEVVFPLREHPIHGITGLRAYEKYDDAGYVLRYDYQWKRIVPKMGIQLSHITSWGNDPHDAPDTPEEYRVETEPHHHHYDPQNRKNRCENYNIRTLRDAFKFIEPYILEGKEYTGKEYAKNTKVLETNSKK
ncbi:DUF6516 family protein (plasmid) [Paenibacillus thiaminolyticus]|uniref:toxin-antitoxin system TumE family protein n=1 Tax=Paenibacillus thiaminolyticus TaxID=49283 RepID=UPI0023312218|nr:DUF6516 family protein [Paenibacillus thiaminolyticus]WCF11388.1 DUF6516 family protein [Paenibacillus thiaminolyticus]